MYYRESPSHLAPKVQDRFWGIQSGCSPAFHCDAFNFVFSLTSSLLPKTSIPNRSLFRYILLSDLPVMMSRLLTSKLLTFQIYTIYKLYKIYKSYKFYLYNVYLAQGGQVTNANSCTGRKNCIYSVCGSCRWEALC